MTFHDIDNIVREVMKKANYPTRMQWFLYHLSNADTNALEIGVWTGRSTAYMLRAGAKVTGIDINGVSLTDDRFTFIQGDSLKKKTQKAASRNAPYNLAFQDSSHHYWPSKIEWDLYSPLVKGVWVCDDIGKDFHNSNPHPSGDKRYQDPPDKGMVEYFNEIPVESKKIYYNVLRKRSGVGVVLL